MGQGSIGSCTQIHKWGANSVPAWQLSVPVAAPPDLLRHTVLFLYYTGYQLYCFSLYCVSTVVFLYSTVLYCLSGLCVGGATGRTPQGSPTSWSTRCCAGRASTPF